MSNTLSGNRTQGLRMASGDFTTKPTVLHCLGIEPRATAWKAVMLPLHQQCCQSSIIFDNTIYYWKFYLQSA